MTVFQFKQGLLAGILFSVFESNAQIPKGSWRDHLSYNTGKIVAIANDRIYTIADQALYYYDKTEGSIHKISKINGLSDLEPGYAAYSQKHKKMLVVYNNGNIDVFTGDSKRNFPDIKLKNMVGNKSIQHINMVDDYAYLSFGFGIVVFNLSKNEISDSYIIGSGGSYLKVNSTAIFNDTIYASTDIGLYKADVNNPFLSNYNNWKKETNMLNPNAASIATEVFDNQLLVLNTFQNGQSSLLNRNNGTQWDTIYTNLDKIRSISVSAEKLVIIKEYHLLTINSNWETLSIYSAHNAAHALYDLEENLWIADSQEGLLLSTKENYKTVILPNGPAKNYVFEMEYNSGDILVAPGGYAITGENVYFPADVFQLTNEFWSNLKSTNLDSIQQLADVVCFEGIKSNSYYAGTWGYGLIEVLDGKVSKTYNTANTNGVLGNFISSCKYDRDGNLWIMNRERPKPIVVKTPEGKWYSFDYDLTLSNKQTYKFIPTRDGNFWHISQRGMGIFVWNQVPEEPESSNFTSFAVIDKSLKLLNNNLFDIEQDLEGTIWIGTADGVVVYDYPERVGEEPMYARVPQIVVDGYLKNLLEGEMVTSIAVDGANRKWIGTSGGGLFLVSADGTEQIFVWNVDNSKLLSNNILALEINQKTGEVFIGTDKGVQSYMSTATEGNADFGSVYAFPNPVKNGYDGLITVRGLQYQTNIKITDIAGHLVFETTSNGGDAIWNGKNMEGEDVASGIYLVLGIDETGEESVVTKILIVR